MVFSKTCPICKQDFISLETYMSHIKSNHDKVRPEEFVKSNGELKWSFRSND
ncbi:hypothetical protein [Nitrosopumilus ureiphilus]|uniref:hypothetical protein n=1 Tax=Nitrosopumilus ureiphilus TaxID=1470067 RepID=UPI0015CBBF33|nr:hypothetical protein [Nitrosopumilus ureiphilus]